MLEGVDRVIHVRAAWLRANKEHHGFYVAVSSHMKVVVGRKVLSEQFTAPSQYKADGIVFDKFVCGIPIVIDETRPDRFDIEETPMATEIDIDPDGGRAMFLDETAEEAVARIVAQNPDKHGVTLAERQARAAALAKREAADADAFFEETDDGQKEGVPQTEEGVGQNKGHDAPDDIGRVTAGSQRTEVESDVSARTEMVNEGNQADGETFTPAAGAEQDQDQSACAHVWPEEPEEDTSCPLCQVKFVDWANS